jgi:membrane protein DedA with SNARE-associated domain
MFLESSFFPFPSEVVMPPAGYLASRGEMSVVLVVVCGIVGSVLGALFNYWIAIKWGRKFFDRFGKYFFVSPEAIDKAELFFERHGHVSTFTARLLPVIRQYVSLPAGLARMNLFKFCLCTALGSGIWAAILTLLGYWLGSEIDAALLKKISVGLVAFCAVIVVCYVVRYKRRRGSGGAKRTDGP